MGDYYCEDLCGEFRPTYGEKSTYIIHNHGQRHTGTNNYSNGNEYAAAMCYDEPFCDSGQDCGRRNTFDIHTNGKRRRYGVRGGTICNRITPPWLTEVEAVYKPRRGPCEDFITEYMENYRERCPRNRYGSTRLVHYGKPLPIHSRPQWNKSIKVSRAPYKESLEAAEAKLRLLDGLLGDETDPQSRMVLMLVRQQEQERYRQYRYLCDGAQNPIPNERINGPCI